MKHLLFTFLAPVFGVLLVAEAIAAGGAVGEPDLQGEWKVVSAYRDGRLLPPYESWLKLLIYDDKIVFTRLGGWATTRAYRTDPSKNPKHLDVFWGVFGKDGKEIVETGVYEIENGVLRICQGASRPAESKDQAGGWTRHACVTPRRPEFSRARRGFDRRVPERIYPKGQRQPAQRLDLRPGANERRTSPD